MANQQTTMPNPKIQSLSSTEDKLGYFLEAVSQMRKVQRKLGKMHPKSKDWNYWIDVCGKWQVLVDDCIAHLSTLKSDPLQMADQAGKILQNVIDTGKHVGKSQAQEEQIKTLEASGAKVHRASMGKDLPQILDEQGVDFLPEPLRAPLSSEHEKAAE